MGPSIGHIHLKVADLDRAIHFYQDVLGMDLITKLPGAAFLSWDGYHHHIGLNTWESEEGLPPAPGTTGLYHFAILYPTRKHLAIALKRLMAKQYPTEGAADHGVSEAIYLHDPDMNGIELYCDKPKAQWPRKDGKIAMPTKPLDIDALLAEAD